MNKYQKEISKRAKLIKRKSGMSYNVCRKYAKIRAIYDAWRTLM